MASKNKCVCCTVVLIVVGLVVILVITLIATSVHVLNTTEMGLLYVKTTQKIVETKLYRQGTQMTKPFSYFISNSLGFCL